MHKSEIEWHIVLAVRSIRMEKKYTQRDLASLLGVSPGYIGQVESENNRSMYSYDQLNVLAKHFECSLKDFMPEKPV